jgi:hypothetical protein
MLSIDGSYKKTSGLYSPEETSGNKPLVMSYFYDKESEINSPEPRSIIQCRTLVLHPNYIYNGFQHPCQ